MGLLPCEKLVNRLGLHFGAGEECEEQAAAERMCDAWNCNSHSSDPELMRWRR